MRQELISRQNSLKRYYQIIAHSVFEIEDKMDAIADDQTFEDGDPIEDLRHYAMGGLKADRESAVNQLGWIVVDCIRHGIERLEYTPQEKWVYHEFIRRDKPRTMKDAVSDLLDSYEGKLEDADTDLERTRLKAQIEVLEMIVYLFGSVE